MEAETAHTGTAEELRRGTKSEYTPRPIGCTTKEKLRSLDLLWWSVVWCGSALSSTQSKEGFVVNITYHGSHLSGLGEGKKVGIAHPPSRINRGFGSELRKGARKQDKVGSTPWLWLHSCPFLVHTNR